MNLFETLFSLIERPRITFIRIAISEQKNYVYTLFACAGPFVFAIIFAVARIGELRIHFGLILSAIYLIGPIFGIAVFSILSSLLSFINRFLWDLKSGFRISASMLSYSLAPLVAASLVILPIQLGIFGSILFSTEPTPYEYKGEEFWVLFGIEILFVLWTVFLGVVSYSVLLLKNIRALITTLLVFGILALLIYSGGEVIKIIFT